MILVPVWSLVQAASGGGGGIDPTLFYFCVGGLSSALVSVCLYLYRKVEKENAYLRKLLEGYRRYAPGIVEVVESTLEDEDFLPPHGPTVPRRSSGSPVYVVRKNSDRRSKRRPS